jgi:purine-binding chemotaxis protein CheW
VAVAPIANKAASPAAGSNQYLTFDLAGEAYGVDILKVQEIRGWQPVRELPDTPSYIKGVMDLRGTILPIIDLRERFGLDPTEYTSTTVVIILNVWSSGSNQTMGIVVDNVSDVIDVEAETVKPMPTFGAKINVRYIKGMLSGETMLMLLDADKLLNPDELAQFENLGL